MNNNLSAIFQLMRTGGNPQALLSNMVQSQAQSNPVMNNLLQMMNSGNSSGIETLARNICKEKGIDADALLSQLKHNTYSR